MSSDNCATSVSIGCQGWNYDDWVSRPAETIFYPAGTRAVEMLELYARIFQTVEVDSTFYAIPPTATIDNWYLKTPPGFKFSLKLPQEITHQHRLKRQGFRALAEFCERIRVLQDKLAIVLIQLPPRFDADENSLNALKGFLPEIPQDIRFSMEFRSVGWMNRTIAGLLAEFNVAPAIVEGPWISSEEMLHFGEEAGTEFAYIRWMGARDISRFDRIQRDRDENLQLWSERIRKLCRRVGRVFGYFNNHYEGHSPASANKLKFLLGQTTPKASEMENQRSLF